MLSKMAVKTKEAGLALTQLSNCTKHYSTFGYQWWGPNFAQILERLKEHRISPQQG